MKALHKELYLTIASLHSGTDIFQYFPLIDQCEFRKTFFEIVSNQLL